MTIESAFFIEPKIVFGEIQPLLENNFSLFQIHRKKTYPLLNFMLDIWNRAVRRSDGKGPALHICDGISSHINLINL